MKQLLLLFALCGFYSLNTVEKAQAALMVNSESAFVNPDTKQATFTIDFNIVPNFFSLDEFNRQANSFQYFIEADGQFPIFRGSPYYSNLETIVRGEEIHVGGDIRFRSAFPSSDEPTSGGWGALRGSVPYTLNGNTLKFSAPLELVGDSDGLFSYRLEWYESGSIIGSKDNKSVLSKSVKEPSSIPGMLIMFVASGASVIMKRKYKGFLTIEAD